MSGRVVIGVAIAIPDPHAGILSDWRRRVGDPAAQLVFPHVTLLPPTPVAADDLDEVERHLKAAARQRDPFDMHLSGTGTFRPTSPVVFVQVAAGVSDCELLERDVRRGPLHRELDFPYHPHVTVAQDIDDTALDTAYDGMSTFVARFRVDRFMLFTRDRSGLWERRSEFVLGG